MADLGTLLLNIRANLADLDKDLADAKGKGASAGGQIGDSVTAGVDEKLKTLGSKLTKTLTPVAGAVAVTSGVIAQSWNNAQRTMQATTGATGAKLDSLMASVKNVTGTVKGGMGAISETMATLAAKTGMTGPPLEKLTQQVMGLKELGIQVTATDVGGAFGRWSIPTDQWSASLDRLFHVSQATGQTVPVLLGRLSEFAPVLQGLGYNFDSASLLVGKLSDPALVGLKHALEMIVKTGTTDVPGAFAVMTDSIRNAQNPTEGMALAVADFGAKAGPELYAAVMKGKFGLDELAAKVDGEKVSIKQADEANRTFIDRMGLWKDKIAADVGPVAEKISFIATGIAGVGQAANVLGQVIGWVKGLGAAADVAAVSTGLLATAEGEEGLAAGVAAAPSWALAGAIWAVSWPVLAVIAAIALLVAAVILIIKHWDGIKAATTAAWDWIWGKIKQVVGLIVDLFLNFTLVGLIIKHWDEIKAATTAAWDWIWGKIKQVVGLIVDLFLNFTPVGLLIKHWDDLKAATGAAWDWITGRINDFVGFVSGIPGKIAGALGDLFSPLIGAARDAIHWLEEVASKIASLPANIGGSILSGLTGGLLSFDTGGVVPGPVGQPQLAIVHGGEQVSTPGQLEAAAGLGGGGGARGGGAAGDGGGGGGGGGDVYHIHIGGDLITERRVATTIHGLQQQMIRRGQLQRLQ
jgi:hypothetical protein